MVGRLLALLLVANAAWFVWAQGWLAPVGLAPPLEREPERLARQVDPERLRVVPLDGASAARAAAAAPGAAPAASQASDDAAARAGDASRVAALAPVAPAASMPDVPDAPAATASGGECLVAGVFDEPQIAAVRRAAAARLPAGRWRIDTVALPGRWMVYVGKLDGAELAGKRAELRALGVDIDHPGAALEPGLSLGRFATQEAAERGLATLARKGVRGARVLEERRDAPGYVLRLPAADAALRADARALRTALGGREWRACD